jgi:hypothetical protein
LVETSPLSVILNTTTEMSPEMPKASGNAAAMPAYRNANREPIFSRGRLLRGRQVKAAGVINSRTEKETAARPIAAEPRSRGTQ